MQYRFLLPVWVLSVACNQGQTLVTQDSPLPAILQQNDTVAVTPQAKGTWAYFLQHLPTASGPVLDYRGQPISNQSKHAALIKYDIGTKDLQQCADALMRLRAEYLYGQQRYREIGFHFTTGGYYTFSDYCRGIRPAQKGGGIMLAATAAPSTPTHNALRKYLDHVYAYANTVSLCQELKPTYTFEIGTVIIYPGYPGHCCIIVNEGTTRQGEKVYQLAEGYMPAQSIYILANPYQPQLSPWYTLKKGIIKTSSCEFRSYQLRKFE